MIFSRRISALDLTFAAAGARSSDDYQIVAQCMIEGVGEIDEAALRCAIEKSTDAIPAARFVLKGFWGFKRWTAVGPLPRLRCIESNWSGESLNDADFLDAGLDIFEGPVAEVVYVTGRKTHLVFRVHHAVMDGNGFLDFVTSFFKALRNEGLESFLSPLIAEDIFSANAKKPNAFINTDVATPLGEVFLPTLMPSRPVYQRLTLRGMVPFILPKLMLDMADIARSKNVGLVRFFLPVNLRRYKATEKTSANLAGVINVEVKAADNERSLIKKINTQMDESRFANSAMRMIAAISLWVPFFVLQFLARRVQQRPVAKKRYIYSGLMNTIGPLRLVDFSTRGFKAETIVCAPSRLLRFTPLLTLVCANDECIEIILATANAEGAAKKLQDLTEILKARLLDNGYDVVSKSTAAITRP